MTILNLISSSSYIVVNKDLMRLLGINEAILLGELASESIYWENSGKTDDGWFYSTIQNLEEKTTLNAKKQQKALNTLQKHGLIDIALRGIPCKRYIKLNEENIEKLLIYQIGKNGETRFSKTAKQGSPKLLTNKKEKKEYIKNIKTSTIRTSKSQGGNEEEQPTLNLEPLILSDGNEWTPTAKKLKTLTELYGTSFVVTEFKRMALWLDDNPNKRKTKDSMNRFVTGWLERQAKTYQENKKEQDDNSYTVVLPQWYEHIDQVRTEEITEQQRQELLEQIQRLNEQLRG